MVGTHNREQSVHIDASPVKSEGLVPPYQAPGPSDLYWTDEPSECMDWKSNVTDVQGSQRAKKET